MKKIINKYFFLIAFLCVNYLGLSQVPEPEPRDCCEEAYNIDKNMPAYEKCKEELLKDPNYCESALPIDNSFYILMGTVSAVALASVVILKKIKHKKTPM